MSEMTRRAFLGVFAVGVAATALGGLAAAGTTTGTQPKVESPGVCYEFHTSKTYEVGDYITLTCSDKNLNGTYRFESDRVWRRCGWHPYD